MDKMRQVMGRARWLLPSAACSLLISCGSVVRASTGVDGVVILGFALGFTAGPFAILGADMLLADKERVLRTWWGDMSRVYREYTTQAGTSPTRSLPGKPGASAIWADEVRRLGTSFGLEPWQLEMADAAGIEWCKRPVLLEGARWSFELTGRRCAVMGALSGTAAVAASIMEPPVALAFAIASAALLVCAACDVACRTIPWETCAVLFAAGLAYQVLLSGLMPAAISALVALALVGVMAVLDRALRLTGRPGQIGDGDLRMLVGTLCCCGISGMLAGALAFAVVFVVHAAARKVARGDGFSMKSYVAMAPMLLAWGLVGMAYTPLYAAFAQ